MRIGIDAHSAEQDGTGNCTYYRNLILEIARIDSTNQYFIFATNQNHPFYRRLEEHQNFQIVPITGSPAWFRVFVSLPLATYRTRIDLLHIQYFAPLFHAGRLVNTIHDLAAFHFPEYFSYFERFLFQSLLPPSSRKAHQILTASQVSKNDLIAMLNVPEEKIKVSFCGVSDAFSNSTTEEKIQEVRKLYSLEGKFLLYVGRIDPRKNLVRLIQAYTLLRSRGVINHKLVIAGKVHLKPRLLQKTLKHSPYAHDIAFCGYVPYEYLPALYSAADVFVYTSEYEGFGLPPLEAMAAGIPVVASDISIFREILGNAAALVHPRDVESIAGGIQRILTDDEYRTGLVLKGKERVKKFAWKNTAKITLQAYEKAFKEENSI
jgi:glycosyltransferase involved in cell wall biosynthesis